MIGGRERSANWTRAKWPLRLASVAVFGLLWEAGSRRADSVLLPTCLETLRAMFQLAGGAELWRALAISNEALVVGFGAAALFGIPFGLWVGRSERLQAYADPWLDVLLILPLAALGPVVIMVVGVGQATRAAVVWLFATPVIVVNAIAAMQGLNPRLVEMARVFGASRACIWRRILLPAALPTLLGGLRVGLSRALTGMVIAELLVVAAGIGRLILEYQGQFDAPAVYAVAGVTMIEAVLLTRLAARVERRVAFWADADRT